MPIFGNVEQNDIQIYEICSKVIPFAMPIWLGLQIMRYILEHVLTKYPI